MVLTARTPPPADPFFDAAATFVGAVGTVDWTAGWTRYPQNRSGVATIRPRARPKGFRVGR